MGEVVVAKGSGVSRIDSAFIGGNGLMGSGCSRQVFSDDPG